MWRTMAGTFSLRLSSMPIELPEDTRAEAIASIQRYFDANMDEPIGNIAAGGLLGLRQR